MNNLSRISKVRDSKRGKVLPNQELVTFQVMTAEQTWTSYANIRAVLNPVTRGLMGNDLYRDQTSGTWLLWTNFLKVSGESTNPKQGDQIVQQDGTTWIVNRVQWTQVYGGFSCECRRVAPNQT